jgi:hypothetical protein
VFRNVRPLVPAVFAVVSTHQSALRPRGVLPMVRTPYVIHKEGLCLSSEDDPPRPISEIVSR